MRPGTHLRGLCACGFAREEVEEDGEATVVSRPDPLGAVSPPSLGDDWVVVVGMPRGGEAARPGGGGLVQGVFPLHDALGLVSVEGEAMLTAELFPAGRERPAGPGHRGTGAKSSAGAPTGSVSAPGRPARRQAPGRAVQLQCLALLPTPGIGWVPERSLRGQELVHSAVDELLVARHPRRGLHRRGCGRDGSRTGARGTRARRLGGDALQGGRSDGDSRRVARVQARQLMQPLGELQHLVG